MQKATECESCTGCRHRYSHDEEDSWCYMFREPPECLPCAQHDCFSEQRKLFAAFFTRFLQKDK